VKWQYLIMFFCVFLFACFQKNNSKKQIVIYKFKAENDNSIIKYIQKYCDTTTLHVFYDRKNKCDFTIDICDYRKGFIKKIETQYFIELSNGRRIPIITTEEYSKCVKDIQLGGGLSVRVNNCTDEIIKIEETQ